MLYHHGPSGGTLDERWKKVRFFLLGQMLNLQKDR